MPCVSILNASSPADPSCNSVVATLWSSLIDGYLARLREGLVVPGQTYLKLRNVSRQHVESQIFYYRPFSSTLRGLHAPPPHWKYTKTSPRRTPCTDRRRGC